MITRRFVLTGFVTTAAASTASQFLPVEWPKPYAIVYGVSWDLEAIEYPIWTQQDALKFAKFGIGGIDRFREITDIVYNVPMEPLPEKMPSWRQDTLADQMKRFNKPIQVQDNGFTNIVGPQELDKWREALRPDLGGKSSVEWVQEQLDGYRKFGGEPEWLTEGLRGPNAST